MARGGTGKARQGEPTLTASDWAEAALQLVAEQGLKALTVSTLAMRLGVTKGSFYWHFQSRSDLLAAALARWEQRATAEHVQALEAMPDPRRRLELILAAASEPPRSRSLYAALAEAAADPIVRRALTRVASMRVEYLQRCYAALGSRPAQARAQAVLVYAAYRGLLQLAHEAPATLPADWPTYAALVRSLFVPDIAAQERRSAPKR